MSRLTVNKTYKLYIAGKFPRTESGRYEEIREAEGALLANVSWASRKDFRNAVVAAQEAQKSWAGTSAYLKGQILYRVAEMLEGRAAQFVAELVAQGVSKSAAEKDVAGAVDLLVHYAGWSDKFQAIFSSVNPVASAHFNFSLPEPVGTVGIVAPENGGLSGLVSAMVPVMVGGNTCVVLASGGTRLSTISFAEVLATSDVPGGVMNLLTGKQEELVMDFAKHRGVNSILLCGGDEDLRKNVEIEAAENMKRVVFGDDEVMEASPYLIMDFQEVKTTWHPVGV